MATRTVTCLSAMQVFEVPPNHAADTIQCPLCGSIHPVPPPILPPPSRAVAIIERKPPELTEPRGESRAQRFLRASTLGLTLACGIGLGVAAGLAFAAVVTPTEHALQAELDRRIRDAARAEELLTKSRSLILSQEKKIKDLEVFSPTEAELQRKASEMADQYVRSQAVIHLLMNDESDAVRDAIRFHEGRLGPWWDPQALYARVGSDWFFGELGVRPPRSR